MPATTLVLAAVPGGRARQGGLRRLSVALFPRLSGGATLADFPGMLTWTQRLVDAEPTVFLDLDGQPWSATVEVARLEPGLWQALFPPELPVEDFALDDLRGGTVRSSPTVALAGLVEQTYTEVGLAAPGRVPTAAQVIEVIDRLRDTGPEPWRFDADRVHWDLSRFGVADRERGEVRQRADLASNPPSVAEALGRFRAVRDLGRVARSNSPWPGGPDPGETARRLDFHGVVAALAHHPALVRALGLVFDLALPDDAPAIGAAPPANAPYPTMHVRGWSLPLLDQPDQAERLALPRTAVDGQDDAFLPAPTALAGDVPRGGVRRGTVQLDPALWSVVQLDVEGAVNGLLALAERDPAGHADPSVAVGLPALRSDGLGLAALTQAAEALLAFDRSARLDAALRGAGPEEVLTAAHLTQGYRVDVWWEARRAWFSLHQRSLGYDVGGVGWAADDEGFATAALASPPGRPNVFDVAEVLVRWTGWSLSTPRPFLPVGRAATEDDPGTEPEGGPPPTSPLRVVSSRPVPRSLPGLRFGDRYRVRLRAVDVGGGGLVADDAEAGDGLPVEPVGRRYLRFEPVAAPLVVTAEPGQAGRASPPRLAIRSDNQSPADDLVATADTAVAWLLAPKATVDLVERHGVLDGAAGRVRPAAEVHSLLASRDVAVDRTAAAGEPVVAHLPDPLARGVVLRGLPGVPDGWWGTVDAGGVLRFEQLQPIPFEGARAGAVALRFDGAWPDPLPVKVALVEGSGLPSWDAATRTLTVCLRKGRRAEVAVSSLVDPGDLDLLGVWEWFAARLERDPRAGAGLMAPPFAGPYVAGGLAHAAAVTRLAREGGHWALTPATSLRVVHEVAQPVGVPVLRRWSDAHPLPEPDPGTAAFDVSRATGSITAELTGGVAVDLPSTGSVTVTAAWTDPVDDPEADPDAMKQAQAHGETVGRTQVPEGAAVGDVLATPGAQPAVVAGADALAWSMRGRIAATAVPRDCRLVHTIGDTRHHEVRYTAVALSRDAPPGESSTAARESAPATIHVPSSAPPAAPVVSEAVPAFAWDRQHDSDVRTSVRAGRTIRVYLERPWWSSGAGEQLGVACLPAAQEPGPWLYDLRDRVSLWGLDPLHGGGFLEGLVPRRWHFPEAAAGAEGVQLRQFQRTVDVAGHAVFFDRSTKRWFADVVIDGQGAYGTFVRLVVVRFQPHAIPGEEISAPVVVDHLQLTPDRAVTVATVPDDPRHRRVVVSGVASTPMGSERGGARSLPNQVTVTVEQAVAGLGPELGWEPAPAGAATVVGAPPSPLTDDALWRGEVRLADPSGTGLRLLVTEREYYATADAQLGGLFGEILLGLAPSAGRIVFAEAVPLG